MKKAVLLLYALIIFAYISTPTLQTLPSSTGDSSIKVYLAGPDVFRPNAVEIGKKKRDICKKHGLVGVFPLDNELDLSNITPYEMGIKIFEANKQLMESCDCVIANMTPYRSPSTDVGTAFEMGYMAGSNKPVFGYTNQAGIFFKRTADFCGTITLENGIHRDNKGNALEQFDMIDNLMLDGAITTSSKVPVAQAQEAMDLYDDLTLFEACVVQVAKFFADEKH